MDRLIVLAMEVNVPVSKDEGTYRLGDHSCVKDLLDCIVEVDPT